MDTNIEYRIERGLMLLKSNDAVVELIGFFNDEPKAHGLVKELVGGVPANASQFYLVAAERLVPTEVSEEPL